MVSTFSRAKIDIAEDQIEDRRQEISYDTREFTIEYIVNKYLEVNDDDLSDIYVPEYQREFVWDIKRQSRLIESVVLGLPIPLLFVAEIKDSGRLEIVDGSQRVRTLSAFMRNQLQLTDLRTLDSLNGFKFEDFSPSRQRKFRNIPIRMLVLSDRANENVRNDMFDRINTSSLDLTPMETRKGVYRGDFIDFVFECSNNETFIKLCPIYKYFKNRYEEAELILRFFAFSETYPKFRLPYAITDLDRTGVARFLDEYVLSKRDTFTDHERKQKLLDFEEMLEFVNNNFPSGFKKRCDSEATGRPYFEAISVGSLLAIREKKNLEIKDLWDAKEKNNQTSSFDIPIGRYQTHKPENMLNRIDYVKNQLLRHSL